MVGIRGLFGEGEMKRILFFVLIFSFALYSQTCIGNLWDIDSSVWFRDCTPADIYDGFYNNNALGRAHSTTYADGDTTITLADASTQTIYWRLFYFDNIADNDLPVPDSLPLFAGIHCWTDNTTLPPLFEEGNTYLQNDPGAMRVLSLTFSINSSGNNSGTWWWGDTVNAIPTAWAEEAVMTVIRRRLNDACDLLATAGITALSGKHVDVNRVYLRGTSMGGTGTYRMGIKYPDVFAAVHAHAGFADFKGPCGAFCTMLDAMVGTTGQQCAGIDGEQYIARDYTDMSWFLRTHKGISWETAYGNGKKYEPPYIFMSHGTTDGSVDIASADRVYHVLDSLKYGVSYFRHTGGHADNNGTHANWMLNIRKNQSYLALTNNSTNTATFLNRLDSIGWKPSSIIDSTNEYEVDITGAGGTADITLRNLQNLVHDSGTRLEVRIDDEITDTVTADENDAITVEEVPHGVNLKLHVLGTVPENLTATDTTSNSVSLRWDHVQGPSDIYYKVYANSVFIDTSIDTTYTCYLLESGKSYSFYVTDAHNFVQVQNPSSPLGITITEDEGSPSDTLTITTDELSCPTGTIHPSMLIHLGAFRCPQTDAFLYSFGDIEFNPNGPAAVPGTTLNGSIFCPGSRPGGRYIGEITIPVPSYSNDPNAIPAASVIHAPVDFKPADLETGSSDLRFAPAVGYLPTQEGQNQPYLYTCFGEFFEWEGHRLNSFGATDINFTSPTIYGGWRVGPTVTFTSPAYMTTMMFIFSMTINDSTHLVCGGSRIGPMSKGPTLTTYRPWLSGADPLPATADLSTTPILLYDADETGDILNGARHGDYWQGATVIKCGSLSAVIVTGLLGCGHEWYTQERSNGDKGWLMSSYRPVILFYNPADLEAVYLGADPALPQPYAVLNIDTVLLKDFTSTSNIGTSATDGPTGMAFDSSSGYLYLSESYVLSDGRRAIHAFELDSSVLSGYKAFDFFNMSTEDTVSASGDSVGIRVTFSRKSKIFLAESTTISGQYNVIDSTSGVTGGSGILWFVNLATKWIKIFSKTER